MRLLNVAIAVLSVSVMLCETAEANIIASSTFNANSDGWLGVDLTYPTSGPPYSVLNTQVPDYNATGGNPGGYIQNSLDTPYPATFYWSAPSKFLGDVSGAYGGTLSFDLFDNPINNPYNQEDIILTGGGKTVVFALTSNPGVNWTPYSISLSEINWKLNTLTGSAATQADMLTVLGNLSSLYIRGEYQIAADTRGLDNVILNGTAAVPEPSSLSLALLGLSLIPMVAVYRRRSKWIG